MIICGKEKKIIIICFELVTMQKKIQTLDSLIVKLARFTRNRTTMLGAPALSLVLKPDLDGSRGHAEFLGKIHSLVRTGEEGLFKHLVEAVDLIGCGTLSLGLDHTSAHTRLRRRAGRRSVSAAGVPRGDAAAGRRGNGHCVYAGRGGVVGSVGTVMRTSLLLIICV